MSPINNILPAVVALAALASAQKSCSNSRTLTVTNTAQLASVSACSTYSGSIAIATDATDITLDGPTRITGDLVAVPNGNLQSFEANDLEIVDGLFSMPSLANLGSITMPNLREVSMFSLTAPGQNLLSLGFGTPGLVQVNNLTIDTTSLQDLTGIDLSTAGSVTITNNLLLTSLSMSLVNATGDITIRGNSAGLAVTLDELKSTNNLLVNGASSVSLSSLVNVTGQFAMISNTFSNLTLSNLTRVTGFTVQDNDDLAGLSVPKLFAVGSINVNDNDALKGALSFPSLTLVAGAANLTGAFSSVTFPKLERVLGTFYVESSNSSIQSSCNTFSNDPSSEFAKSPVCSAAATSTSSTGSPTSSGGSSSSTSNAAGHYGVPATTYSLFGAFAAILGLML